MIWGTNFANICYRYKVRLVNWPLGIPVPGIPEGLRDISKIPVTQLRAMVKDRVEFYQQEAKENARKADADDMFEDDSDDEAEGLISEWKLVRFVPWSDGKCSGHTIDQINVSIYRGKVAGT